MSTWLEFMARFPTPHNNSALLNLEIQRISPLKSGASAERSNLNALTPKHSVFLAVQISTIF